VRQRLPLVLSATALLVALFGATPIGDAARNAIPFALFARNAGKVGGIGASRAPKPGRLLPLGGDRKFPRSVLPRGFEGPQGPPGPQGPAGPAGPPATRMWAVVDADGTLYKGGNGTNWAQHVDTGVYQVGFDQNVDGCAAVASTGTHLSGPGGSDNVPAGFASTLTHGSIVSVITEIPGGYYPFRAIDRGFVLAVFC
jgi:hypothetical protein